MSGQGYYFGGKKAEMLAAKLAQRKKLNKLDTFAESLAEGASIKQAAKDAGVSDQLGPAMFMQLCTRWKPQGIGKK